MSTYTIQENPRRITCHLCGLTSYHPDDIQHHYCANCHRFHNDWQDTVYYLPYLRLLTCLQLVYRKHHLDDPALGWAEVDNQMQTTLAEVMGDVGFQHWLHQEVVRMAPGEPPGDAA